MADDKLEVIKKIDQALMSAGRLLLQQLNKVSIKAKEEISKLDPNSPTLAEDRKRINSKKFDAMHELKARYQKTKEFLGKHKKALVIGTAVAGTAAGGLYAYGKYKEHKRKKQKAINMETYIMTGLEKRFHKNLGWALYGVGFSDKPTTIVNFLKENKIDEEMAVLLLNTVNLMEAYTIKETMRLFELFDDRNMKISKRSARMALGKANVGDKIINAVGGAASGTKKAIVGAATNAGGKVSKYAKEKHMNYITAPNRAKNVIGKVAGAVGRNPGKTALGVAGVTAAALGARALWKKRQAKKAAQAQKV